MEPTLLWFYFILHLLYGGSKSETTISDMTLVTHNGTQETTTLTHTGTQDTTSLISTSDVIPVSDEITLIGTQDTTTLISMVQNGTTAPLKLNGTDKDLQLSNFIISAVPGNKSEMYIGMKMILTVNITYPKGYCKEVTLTVSQGIQNIDVENQACVLGKAIQADTSAKSLVNYENTGFRRTYEMSYVTKSVNVSYSDTQSDYQQICSYEIYLHNAVDLTDGQNIRIPCLARVTTTTSDVKDFGTDVVFIARTTILKKNKTASFKLDPTTPSVIYTEMKQIGRFRFRAWIPYYQPQIVVKLEGDHNFQRDYAAMYLRVTKFGSNFFPGVDSNNNDTTCKNRWSTPSQWVNRGYYKSENTTDDDVLQFDALVALSNKATIGVNYTLTATIMLDNAQVWNSSVILIANATSKNISSNVSVVDASQCETLSKTRNTSILLNIKIPAGRADRLNLTIITKLLTGEKQSAVLIEKVQYIPSHPVCRGISVDSNQNEAQVILSYVDLVATSTSSTVNLTMSVDLKIVPEKISLGDNHVVSAKIDGMTTELCNIPIENPEIFNDRNGTILSQFQMLLDMKNSSCIDLPVKGQNPPLFWVRMQTLLLRISPAPFNVTIRGRGISCQRHGQKLLQVSFPTSSKTGFRGEAKFCSLIHDAEASDGFSRDCGYHCPCSNVVECSEVLLFMVSHDNEDVWKLCEVFAKNE